MFHSFNIIQEPKLNQFVVIRTKGSTWVRFGTITKINPEFIYLKGFANTRDAWVRRSNLIDCYDPSTLPNHYR